MSRLLLLMGEDTGGGVGAPAFSPADLSPVLWLDEANGPTADTGDPVIGDPISTWIDQSGNGNHATQLTTSKQPTLQGVTNGGQTFNVVRFDGVDDGMVVPAATSLNSPTSFYFAFVVKAASATGAAGMLFSMWDGDDTHAKFEIYRGAGAALNYLFGEITTQGSISGSASVFNDAFHLVEVIVDGLNVSVFVDGAADGTATLTAPISTAATDLDIGMRGGALPAGADYAQVLLYPTVPSPADRANVQAYLRGRAGLS
jgi:hypothetical protein